MDNKLFSETGMRKYAKDKDFKLNHNKRKIIINHLKKLENNEFVKETSNYDKFEHHILMDLLGYDIDDHIKFDETVDIGSKRSEFVLQNKNEKFMIVELKGQLKNLDEPQKSYGNKTPVEQAFEYSRRTKSANWIMVSNYDEFRLYHWTRKDDHISFKFKDLKDPKFFSYFMVAFSKKSHIDKSYSNKLLKNTLVIGKKFEKNFYKLYHETRLMLIKELKEINHFEKEKALHYAQSILNRYMFICFAEDIEELLPEDISTKTIHEPIKNGDISKKTIWNRLNELFGYINEGNDFKNINKYNGGLFKEDFSFITIRDIVEDRDFFKGVRQKWDLKEYALDISSLMGPHGKKINPIYWNLLTISSFDFSSEKDVNILGHVFENSIGDIERLKGVKKGKKKGDGIFYTPPEVTEYICKTTIIPYLSKSGKSTEVTDLIDEYWGSEIEELDTKVKNIKILDPACGSGAFLNRAADLLVEIHKAIHEQKYKDEKNLKPYLDNIKMRREILLNNIYGVDLNEESVEITKLSLFLKVCKKGLELPGLDNNIKTGNSLISDDLIDSRAFKWNSNEGFKEILDNGGFDIIIGNPPYVILKEKNDGKKTIEYIDEIYETASFKKNTYSIFFEMGLKLLKTNGFISYIIPDTILTYDAFEKIRKYFLNNTKIVEIIYFTKKVFDDAEVGRSIIITLKKSKNDILSNGTSIKITKNSQTLKDKDYDTNSLDQHSFLKTRGNKFFILLIDDDFNILEKIESVSINFEKICVVCDGINPGSEEIRNRILVTEKIDNKCQKIIDGRNFSRYSIVDWHDLYVRYDKDFVENLRKEIKDKGESFTARVIKKDHFFDKEKIVTRQTADKIIGTIDNEGYYTKNSVHSSYLKSKCIGIYDLNFLVSILNSDLMTFYYRCVTQEVGRPFSQVKVGIIEQLPIFPASVKEQEPFIEKAKIMFQKKKDLDNEINEFLRWLNRTFKLGEYSQNLVKYYELSFEELLEEMKNNDIKVRKRDDQKLLEKEFNKSLNDILPLIQEIKTTEKEINDMVYQIYGLNDKEIKRIKNYLS